MDNEKPQMIDIKGYEVVRQDYFQGQEEAQFTFNRGYAYINGYGLNLLPEVDYVQFLIDDKEKTLVIKPSVRKIKDSVKWSSGTKKRHPRKIRCITLYYMVYQMMGWNLDVRYRITGCIRESEGQSVLYFPLKEAISYEKIGIYDETGQPIIVERFPEHWKANFGISVMDYENREDIKTYDEETTFLVELSMFERKKEQLLKLAQEAKKEEERIKEEQSNE